MPAERPLAGTQFDPVQTIARALVARRLGVFAAVGPSDELLRDCIADAEVVLDALDNFNGLAILAGELLRVHYPADLFNADNPIVGDDPGTKLVIALREVLEAVSAGG